MKEKKLLVRTSDFSFGVSADEVLPGEARILSVATPNMNDFKPITTTYHPTKYVIVF